MLVKTYLNIIVLAISAIPLTAVEVGIDKGDPRLDEILNYCIDSQNHKKVPGPEDSLHNQCSPWKDRSCCIWNTTREAHYGKLYNFDWNHCSHVKPLSANCSRHFRQDLCFYECSPNVGPWTVKVDNKFRKERFFEVPLCASDCNSWFEECAEDYTCTDNWTTNMEWVKGSGNRCPVGSSCKTFRQIYQTAKYFCETVWDHSWKFVPDADHCMRLWFDPIAGNPNDDVAKWKAIQIIKGIGKSTSGPGVTTSSTFCVISTLVALYISA